MAVKYNPGISVNPEVPVIMAADRLLKLTCGNLQLRNVLLQLLAQNDLAAEVSDGSVVDEQKVGMVAVEDDVVIFR